jgi:hypothetical protein
MGGPEARLKHLRGRRMDIGGRLDVVSLPGHAVDEPGWQRAQVARRHRAFAWTRDRRRRGRAPVLIVVTAGSQSEHERDRCQRERDRDSTGGRTRLGPFVLSAQTTSRRVVAITPATAAARE